MLDDDTIRHLHSGCALLVGTVSVAGVPHAARGHGVRVMHPYPPRLRLVLPDDERLLANLRETGSVAITTADVRTLVSLQLKGRVGPVERLSPEDEEAFERYTAQFVHDIEVTDRHPHDILDRWARTVELVVCEVEVHEMFDQTPGPSAGRSRLTP